MNRFFAIVILALLSLPVSVWAVDDATVSPEEPIPVVNTIDEESVEQEKIIEENKYKQPISKRKIAKKFLAAMGGVAVSSFAIFFLLTIYNKIRDGYLNKPRTFDDEIVLETPEDLNDAIKTFLDKTNW